MTDDQRKSPDDEPTEREWLEGLRYEDKFPPCQRYEEWVGYPMFACATHQRPWPCQATPEQIRAAQIEDRPWLANRPPQSPEQP